MTRQNWSKALGFHDLKRIFRTKIHSELGRGLLAELKPLGSKEKILAKQNFICQSQDYISKVNRTRFDGLEDLSQILQEPQVLDFEQLQKVKNLCSLSCEFNRNWASLDDLEKIDLELVGQEIESLHQLNTLLLKFQKIFDSNGKVKETASAKLTQICGRIRSLKSQINSYLESRYLSTQQDFVTSQEGRVLLLTSASRTLSGVVHGRSASRSSVYIEPQEIVSQNNSLRDLQEQKISEIRRILREFSELVFAFASQLLYNQKVLINLDFYFGLAEFSSYLQASKVKIVEETKLNLKNAYHPLLLLDSEIECVPFSAKLGEEYSYLVVSGANAGGKSVFLKSVGLLTLMVNCGLLIPADEDSQVGLFDKFFVGIGDMQSLDSRLSSFSGYLTCLKEALAHSGARSLVLFDELGSYTDPEQGYALGVAALESFFSNGSIGVISTHLNKIKLFAHHSNACQNVSMSFNKKTQLPSYHLQVGYPADSHALELAAHLQFDQNVLTRAKQLIDNETFLLSKLLSDMGKEKESWQQLNLELRKKLERAKSFKKMYEEKFEFLQRNEKRIKKEQLAKAKQYFENLQAKFSLELKEAKKNKSSRKLFQKSAKVVEQLQEQEFADDNPLISVTEGDTVFVKNFAENGKVLEIDGAKVKVEVGGLIVSCDLRKLYPARASRKTEKNHRQKVLQRFVGKREIKLMGKNFLEAKVEIDRFLDEALLAGLDIVRIVHGKGVLAGKIREYLRERKLKYSIPPEKFGGDGVSEVTL